MKLFNLLLVITILSGGVNTSYANHSVHRKIPFILEITRQVLDGQLHIICYTTSPVKTTYGTFYPSNHETGQWRVALYAPTYDGFNYENAVDYNTCSSRKGASGGGFIVFSYPSSKYNKACSIAGNEFNGNFIKGSSGNYSLVLANEHSNLIYSAKCDDRVIRVK